ncbi:MAG: sugar phosphate isomerase/epimerase family protein [Anaerolineae bacterium]
MRISYCTWSMMKVDIGDAIPAVADIGYHAIELAVRSGWPTALETLDTEERQRIVKLLGDHNLILSAVAGHTSMCEDDPVKNAANMQQLRDAIDLAAELSTANPAQQGEPAIMASLIGGREDEWDQKKELIAERVHALGEYAAIRDVILAVEPHSGTAFDLPGKALWLMEQVNHPAVRLNFDISHFDIRGIGIDACVPAIVPWSVHTHVKDQRGLYPNHEFLTPGSGPFDFVHYLTAMHEAGYTGFVGMEVSVMVQRKDGYDPFVDAALGYYALRHAFNESGVPLAEG